MLLRSEISEGKVYAYDIDGMCDGLHLGTYTVKILEAVGDSLTVESVETSEVFTCGKHMLTTLERVKKMYDVYKDMDKENMNPSQKYTYEKVNKRLGMAILNAIL